MADLALTARLNTSAADTRRGVVRLHPEALAALGLREWDPIALTGGRRTAAVVGIARGDPERGRAARRRDAVELRVEGERDGRDRAGDRLRGAPVQVSGSVLATRSIPADTLRQALLGKVVSVGDAVSLLPRDLGPGTSTAAASQALSRTFGVAWTTELLTVTRSTRPRSGQRATEHGGRVGYGPGRPARAATANPVAATAAGAGPR